MRAPEVGHFQLALPIRAGVIQWKTRELGGLAPPDARSQGIELLKNLHDRKNGNISFSKKHPNYPRHIPDLERWKLQGTILGFRDRKVTWMGTMMAGLPALTTWRSEQRGVWRK